MRVATTQFQRQAVDAILQRQASLSKAELQVATGRRIVTPSDDPAGAKQILDFNQAIRLTEQYQANADTASARLALEETTLGGVNGVLQRVRELAIQANSGALRDGDRLALAAEVRERYAELVALANTRDVNGEYMFAGYKTATQPFSADGSYQGDDGQRLLQVSPRFFVPSGDSGTEVFRNIKGGNGVFQVSAAAGNQGSGVIGPGSVVEPGAWGNGDVYTIDFVTNGSGALVYRVTGATAGLVLPASPAPPAPPADPVADAPLYRSGDAIAFAGIQVDIEGSPRPGDRFTVAPSTAQDLFGMVQGLITTLETGTASDAGKGAFGNGISGFLTAVDQGMDNLNRVRAAVGARLNAVESQRQVNEDTLLYARQGLSRVQDLDYAEAISRMQLDLLGLQAAQQAYVKVQGLSLFNYL